MTGTALRRLFLGLAVGVMGLIDLLSALLSHPPDRLQALRHLVPTDVLDTSRTFTLLAGALLLMIAWGLRRGKRRAFVLALFFCALSVPANLLKAFDFEEATLAVALMFALGVSSDAFRVRSASLRFRILRPEFVSALIALTIYAVVGTWILERQFGHSVSLARAVADAGNLTLGIGQPVELVPATIAAPERRIAEWYARSLPLLSFALVVGVLLAALQPVIYRRRHHAERERVEGLLHIYGDSTVASFALDDDTDYFFSSNGRAVLAYRFESDTLLVIGDPVGPPEEHRSLLVDFAQFCEESDWAFAFFQARPEYLQLYQELGWTTIHLGVDPVLWTARFTLEGSAAGDVRRAVGKAIRSGLEVRHFEPSGRVLDSGRPDRALLEELRAISDEWLASRNAGEKGFCMGRFSPERLARSWLVVAWNTQVQRVEAFVTWEPIWARHGWSLDLMRRRNDSVPGAMELLISRSVEAARERGYALLSLALSALASVGTEGQQEPRTGAMAEDRARVFLRRHLNRFYDFEGLFRWKSKFAPSFEDRFLVIPSTFVLPRVAFALVRAQNPSGFGAYLRMFVSKLTAAGRSRSQPVS